MLRRLQAFVVLSLCAVSIQAAGAERAKAADDSDDEDAADEAPATKQEPSGKAAADSAKEATKQAPTKEAPTGEELSAAPALTAAVNAETQEGGWHIETHGYFRAPLTLGLSSRPDPDNPTGPSGTQISYGPNRVVDSSYYSFAYTRLQEQDWAELTVHAKKKHVDAAIGWMGYWFQGAGYRNFDAAWAPAIAYLALDTDVDVGTIKPNVALTMGAFWPSYGYFEKYDTYTLGRFRQVGEEVNLTVPIDPDLSVVVTEGFGSGRDGSFQPNQQPPIYGGQTQLDLINWENIKLAYKKNAQISLHYNTEWTADPQLATNTTQGSQTSFGLTKKAHLTVLGAEANIHAPVWGHLWLSPSYIDVRNGYALNAGTEVMHSLGGRNLATNYLFFVSDLTQSTGSGSLLNLGAMYENSLSSLQGKERGSVPDVSVSVFGLLTRAKADLPTTSVYGEKASNEAAATGKLNELKYGADATLQATTWFGFMLRYDLVNMDTDHGGYIFSAVSPRVIFSSHFLSSERIYLQYSRYTYGDKMTLGGSWPWGQEIVAGSSILQQPSVGLRPDRNVVKLQAEVAF